MVEVADVVVDDAVVAGMVDAAGVVVDLAAAVFLVVVVADKVDVAGVVVDVALVVLVADAAVADKVDVAGLVVDIAAFVDAVENGSNDGVAGFVDFHKPCTAVVSSDFVESAGATYLSEEN